MSVSDPSVMRANLRLAWEPQQSTQCWGLLEFSVHTFYRGIKGLKDSYLEGHTELSASGTRGASIVKIVCGLLLMFDTQTLDALQSTLNIHW